MLVGVSIRVSMEGGQDLENLETWEVSRWANVHEDTDA